MYIVLRKLVKLRDYATYFSLSPPQPAHVIRRVSQMYRCTEETKLYGS
jgi:hypothetical protein